MVTAAIATADLLTIKQLAIIMQILSALMGEITLPANQQPETNDTGNCRHYSANAHSLSYSLHHCSTENVNVYFLDVTTGRNKDALTIINQEPHPCIIISLHYSLQLNFKYHNPQAILLHRNSSILLPSSTFIIECPLTTEKTYSITTMIFPPDWLPAGWQPPIKYQPINLNYSIMATITEVKKSKRLERFNIVEEIQHISTVHLKNIGEPKEEVSIKKANEINKVVDYIHNHIYDNDLTIETIESGTGIKEATIKKFFSLMYDETAKDYINRLRMQQAAFYLSCHPDDKKMVDLATDLGFGSLQAFDAAFKKYYNMTPKEYREKNKTDKLS